MTEVKFGTCSQDHRKIIKSPTFGLTLQCAIYDKCDVLSPVFLVEANGIVGYNYASAFGRYYYITKIILDKGGRAYVHCEEDVLMSNASEILGCTAWAVRSSVRNPFLPDNMLPKLAKTATQVVNFSGDGFDTSFGGYNYLLTVKGGG